MTETNAERLNRVTRRLELSRGLDNSDWKWLIEQAEWAQELQDIFNIESAKNQWLNTDNGKLREKNKRLQSEIKVTKYRKGEPTVIDWNGERWIKDSQTTFKGGVQRGKKNKSAK